MSDPLSENERTIVSARAEQFQHALAAGGVTDWEPLLAGLTGPARLALLTQLVASDLKYRWERGERPKLEEYVARFPELGPVDHVPAALILEEHRCRVRAGGSVDAIEYRDRFPGQFSAIRSELECAAASWTIPQGPVRPWQPAPDGVVEVSQQYELVRELGRGMFGEVWLARKKPSGIEKAIKILLRAADHDAGQRELAALELIKNLRHPYLLATEDFWVANNRVHVVMELADGTLRGRLKHHQSQGRPAVPVDELFRYIAEAAEGLDFLHDRQITHRDVKPDNILLLHGHAKVADFGLVRRQEQPVEAVSLAGTPAYMAPEVWGGAGGPTSDQYSLAYAYTELRQGRAPLKPRPLAELLQAHRAGEFEFGEVITTGERAVLRRALAAEPHHRYPNCTAFVAALAAELDVPFAGNRREGAAPVGAVLGNGAERSVSPTTDPNGAPQSGGTEVIEETPRTDEKWPRPRLLLGGLVLVCAGLITFGVANYGRQVSSAARYPGGAAPEPETKWVQLADGRSVPEWLWAERGGQRVRFRLIAPQTGPPVAPFYISETKITNALYADGGDAPVVNVTALEARHFAEVTFGGDLPSAEEWDQAAGFFDQQGQPTPTLAPGRAWIDKPTPGPVKRSVAEADFNRFGLLDMAGNGREWTRTVIARNGERRDLTTAPLADTDKLVLRGRSYTLDRPLTFAILETERTAQPQAATPTAASPYTSFRVVLKLP